MLNVIVFLFMLTCYACVCVFVFIPNNAKQMYRLIIKKTNDGKHIITICIIFAIQYGLNQNHEMHRYN